MSFMDRRKFFQGSVAVMSMAAGFLYPGAEQAFAARSSGAVSSGPRPLDLTAGPVPYYAGGTVAAMTSTGVVLQTGSTVRGVQIPADTVVWKEFEATPTVIDLGDWLDVRGTPQSDGTLLATSGMVFDNIGRIDGVVESADSEGLTIAIGGQSVSAPFSAVVDVISAVDASPRAGGTSALRPGMMVGAVGLALPDGQLRVTRVWF